jgi:uncharacterized cofD-like protein
MSKLFNYLNFNKQKIIKNKTIVCIGGGTGMFSLLSGLKNKVSNEKILKVIVSTLDNGGSSGKLITQYGVLPPGDIRNCLVALSKESKILNDLFQYRFDKKLKEHNFGNLMLTALTKITGDFNKAVMEVSRILRVKGEVIPVCLENNDIVGHFEDGTKIIGESQITKTNKKIKEIKLRKKSKPNKRAIDILKKADYIILGPGSLYTSIIPNLLFNEIIKEIKNNKKAKIILIVPVMTQPGETDDFKVSNYITEIKKYLKKDINIVVANNHIPLKTILEEYKKENKFPTIIDEENIKNTKLIQDDLIDINKLVRHDPEKLANILLKIIK